MLIDDGEPHKKPELVFRNLQTLSVKALQEYITELKAEITRCEIEIKRRGSARDTAEAFFSKKMP